MTMKQTTNTLENMRMQRDLWRDRATHDRAALDAVKQAADAHHLQCQAMELTAIEALMHARACAVLLDAVADGTTGIGGAL